MTPKFAALLVAFWAQTAFAEITHLGTTFWFADDEAFGGISGLEITDNGSALIAIGDKGIFVTADLVRNEDRISAIENTQIKPIKGPNGARLDEKSFDTEGIAIDPGGNLYVSFELTARVSHFASLDANEDILPLQESFPDLQSNASLEALAINDQGHILTLPERSGRANRPFPVHVFKDGQWTQPFEIARRGPFLPAGADYGPDGNLYLLERDFTGVGFRSRIRRFAPDGTSEETLLTTPTGMHDNLEGISVWQDQNGDIRITLVSDDNFKFFQRTEIVEYRLTH